MSLGQNTGCDEQQLYDIWLTSIKGIGPATQHMLLYAFGSPERVYNATESDLMKAGISPQRRELILASHDMEEAARILNRCHELGLFLITCQDEIYLDNLKYCPDLPTLLYGRGRPELLRKTRIWGSAWMKNGSPLCQTINQRNLTGGG